MINKKQLLIGTLLLVVAAIPTTLILTQKPQETRSRASASTTLYYTPTTSVSAPVQKNTGETVSFDVMINPGSNLPSLVKLELNYDSTKFQPGATPFAANTSAFPTIVEGPVLQDGKVLISLSIGPDSTKAIQTVTRVGTLTLTTKSVTTGTQPSAVTFGSRSQVLSLSQSDEATENVLSTTNPAYVIIQEPTTPTIAATATPIPTATIAPTATIIPTAILSPTIEPTIVATTVPSLDPTETPQPTPTFTPLATKLAFSVSLHGIGNSGDNANPTLSNLSNKQPQFPSRNVIITIYNDTNQLALTKPGIITYNDASGTFNGTIDMGTTLTEGDYTVRIKEATHLRRLIPGIVHLKPDSANNLTPVALVTGDVNGDNTINILDYNLLVDCYSDLLPAVSCTPENKIKTDLNDNGDVNQFDYNLFLREVTVQSGN
jgi:hypothetical protein